MYKVSKWVWKSVRMKKNMQKKCQYVNKKCMKSYVSNKKI